jgi:hypothetical protein
VKIFLAGASICSLFSRSRRKFQQALYSFAFFSQSDFLLFLFTLETPFFSSLFAASHLNNNRLDGLSSIIVISNAISLLRVRKFVSHIALIPKSRCCLPALNLIFFVPGKRYISSNISA